MPALASAHSPIPGIGRFYSGALHPLVVAPHLMALITLGLLIGQRGFAAAGYASVALIATLAGGLLLVGTGNGASTDTLLLICTVIVALLVIAARPYPPTVLGLAAGVVGLTVGLGSDPEGVAGQARWVFLGGVLAGASLCCLWFAAMTEFATRPWLKIAVRVVASWLAASALLVLALSWVGPRRAGVPGPASAPKAGAASPEDPLLRRSSVALLPWPLQNLALSDKRNERDSIGWKWMSSTPPAGSVGNREV